MRRMSWIQLSFFLALVAPWPLAQCEERIPWEQGAEVRGPSAERQVGLLWEVAGGGSPPSFVYATIHSEDPRVLRLAEPVRRAFDRSERFVMEAVLDAGALLAATTAMFLDEGSSLRELIGPRLFGRAVEAMAQHGVPEMLVDRMKPWAVATTLSMPRLETGMVLDLDLYRQAVSQGKPAHGLESAAEQFAIFDALSGEEQLAYLKDTLESLPQMERMFAELHQAYLDRDLTRLQRLADRYSDLGDPALTDKVMDRLVARRNRIMVERMAEHLAAGGAFIAVGALHLPGEQGILTLLRRKGYRVTPVY
jgi:uncharacterized protein YbaP (TraB family)